MYVLETIYFLDGTLKDKCFELDTDWEKVVNLYKQLCDRFGGAFLIGHVEKISVKLIDRYGEVFESVTPYDISKEV